MTQRGPKWAEAIAIVVVLPIVLFVLAFLGILGWKLLEWAIAL